MEQTRAGQRLWGPAPAQLGKLQQQPGATMRGTYEMPPLRQAAHPTREEDSDLRKTKMVVKTNESDVRNAQRRSSSLWTSCFRSLQCHATTIVQHSTDLTDC